MSLLFLSLHVGLRACNMCHVTEQLWLSLDPLPQLVQLLEMNILILCVQLCRPL